MHPVSISPSLGSSGLIHLPSRLRMALFLFHSTPSSLVAQTVKCLPARQETRVRSLGWEDLLEKDNGLPLQYSCLENPMDRGAW